MLILTLPPHIKPLFKNGYLKELYDYMGNMFDREEIRIFQVRGTSFYCVIRHADDGSSKVDWTTEDLSNISFLDVFEQCPDEMKEYVILYMDSFYDQKI